MVGKLLQLVLLLRPVDVCLDDARRFPPKAVLQWRLKFSQEYMNHCLMMASTEPWGHQRERWYEIAQEAHLYYMLNDRLVDAAPTSTYQTPYKMESLRWIRDTIGWYNYYHGILPDPVPTHHFTWRD